MAVRGGNRRGRTCRAATLSAGRGPAVSERWPEHQDFRTVVEQARALDQAALSLLYSRYLPVVYRYVLGRIGDEHLAEDVTSETFLAMVDAIERVRANDELAFVGWLLGIARNKVAEHYRRQLARPSTQSLGAIWHDQEAKAEAGDPQNVVTARERWAEVATALQRLTEEQRTVVLFRCVLGYETDEVARMMNRQPGAVRALQFRALAALAHFLAASVTNPSLLTARMSRRGPRTQRTQRTAQARRSDDEPR
jgi:RNA polymerase sigma-70 factor (ECF subfamily)